jgi:hypothetical protein
VRTRPDREPRADEEIEALYLQERSEIRLNRIPAWHLGGGGENEFAELNSVTLSESRLSIVGCSGTDSEAFD